jgi:hypothetical protein
MQLKHKEVTYDFEYDFAPNDGTDKVATSTLIDGEILDGQIFITGVWIGEKARPVTVEILALMRQAAARTELEHQRQLRQRLIQAAECRRSQTYAGLPRG